MEGLSVLSELCKRLFSFHFFVNRDLVVLQVGSCLAKLLQCRCFACDFVLQSSNGGSQFLLHIPSSARRSPSQAGGRGGLVGRWQCHPAIVVHCESGLNGLRVVPHSHRETWDYRQANVASQGDIPLIKPRIVADESELSSHLVPTEPGDVIMFNDNLLHAGALNRGKQTRVSFEFALFIPK